MYITVNKILSNIISFGSHGVFLSILTFERFYMHNDALHSLNLFYVLQIRRKRFEHQETNIIFLKRGYIVKSVVTSNRYLDKFITHHEIDYKYLNYSLLYLTRTCIINTVSLPLFIPISFGEVN